MFTSRRQRLIDRIHASAFGKPPVIRRGYDEQEVDDFLDEVIAELEIIARRGS